MFHACKVDGDMDEVVAALFETIPEVAQAIVDSLLWSEKDEETCEEAEPRDNVA